MGYIALNNYKYDGGYRRIQTGPNYEGYIVLTSGASAYGVDNGVVVAGTPLSGAVTSGTLSSGLWYKDANWRFVGRPLASGGSLDPRPYVPSGEILGTRNAFRILGRNKVAGAQAATAVGPKYPINPAPSQPRTSINPDTSSRYYAGRAPDNQNYTPFNTPEGNTVAQGKTGGGVTHRSNEGGILTNVLGSQGTSDRSQWRYNEPVYCQTFTEVVRSESPSLMGNALRYVYRGSSSIYNVNYGGYITGGNAAGVSPGVSPVGAGGYYPAGAPYEPVPYVSGDTSASPQPPPPPFEPIGWFQMLGSTDSARSGNFYDDATANYMTTQLKTSTVYNSYNNALYVAQIKGEDLSVVWSKKMELSTSPTSISDPLENLSKDMRGASQAQGTPARFPNIHKMSNGNYSIHWEVYTGTTSPSGRNYQYRCYYEMTNDGTRVSAQAVRSTGAKSAVGGPDNPIFRNNYDVIKTDLDDDNYLQIVGGFSGESFQIWNRNTGFHPFTLFINTNNDAVPPRNGPPRIKPIPNTDKLAIANPMYSTNRLGNLSKPVPTCAIATMEEMKLNIMNFVGFGKSYDAVPAVDSLQNPSTAPVLDSSNNFYIACWGWSGERPWGSTGKNCVMKCDSNDNVIWSKHYNWEYLNLGGQMWYDIELVDNESKVIVVGRYKADAVFLVHCIDASNGQLLWVRGFNIGNPSTNYLNNYVKIQKPRASDEDVIINFGNIVTSWNLDNPPSAGVYDGVPDRENFLKFYTVTEPANIFAVDQPLYSVGGIASLGTTVAEGYETISYQEVEPSQPIYDFNIIDTTDNPQPQAFTITSGVPT